MMREAKGSGCREDEPAGGLVWHGADTLQDRADRPLFNKEAATAAVERCTPAISRVTHGGGSYLLESSRGAGAMQAEERKGRGGGR